MALASAAVVAVVGGALGLMAALGVVHFGDAGSTKTVAVPAPTVTTTPDAGRPAQIRFPDRLGGFSRNHAPQTVMTLPLPGGLAIGGGDASYGSDETNPARPALTLSVLLVPGPSEVDVAGIMIRLMDGAEDMAKDLKELVPEGQKQKAPAGPFYHIGDFHTFKHNGVVYHCASAKRTKSGNRPGLCVFYDRRADMLVQLFGYGPSVGDAVRLSEIADQARRALSTI